MPLSNGRRSAASDASASKFATSGWLSTAPIAAGLLNGGLVLYKCHPYRIAMTGAVCSASLQLSCASIAHAQAQDAGYVARIRARHEAAHKIAGDDQQRYVQLFYLGDFSPKVIDGATEVDWFAGEGDRVSSSQVFNDPTFVENAKSLIDRVLAGDIHRYIFGGVETTSFRDCVAIGAGDCCCSGVLIAPNAVLSAGHCPRICNTSTVFLGPKVQGAERVALAKDPIIHPEMTVRGEHDLMILILVRSLNIPLAKWATAEQINQTRDVRVVGYGQTDEYGREGGGVRRQVDVPVVSHSCQRLRDQNRYRCFHPTELVALSSDRNPERKKDACVGDSGGPFYVQTGTTWTLAGTVARPTFDAVLPCGDGGIYVRIDAYADWIKQVLADNPPD